jgi:hypothetical protein
MRPEASWQRLPRPVAQSGQPEGLQPAAPPPDVERPAREEAESGLEVRFPFLLQGETVNHVGFSACPCCWYNLRARMWSGWFALPTSMRG